MKWILVLWIFFIAYTAGVTNNSCECGISGKIRRRIIGGSSVQPHQYPWLVSLMLGQSVHCAGAIITDLHVLTAGHCIAFKIRFKQLTVHVGLHDRLERKYSIYGIKNGEIHPEFTSNAIRDINDIAILTLYARMKFSDKVRPICLPTEDLKFDDIPLTVAGWGRIQTDARTKSRYLQEAKVKIVDANKCTEKPIYRNNLVPDSMMCAYSLGKDACQGDSGGPLFATHPKTQNRKWYQFGIVSWGVNCAKPDYPGVYTIVSKYIDWIKHKTQTGMYCDK